ncbi:hypothetical protein [Nocardioides dongxiaopingii]|uniref:hypothetical protein n=1 Tax=Nocardioides dongxiaopingii TaxID=2576036 RepID=UPI0010C769D9|nr:hypothetical protein [Nocardioides dongxiaopingii]
MPTKKNSTTDDRLANLAQATARAAEARAHAEAEVTAADEATRLAVERVDTMRAELTTGTATIAAADLSSAESDATHATLVGVGKVAALNAARVAEYEAVAAEVAENVATEYPPSRVEHAVRHAERTIADAIAGLVTALRERDEASDAAGRRLADAGVPERTDVGRVRYAGVPGLGNNGATKPGLYNVRIDGVPMSPRSDWTSARRQRHQLTERILSTALKASGMRWGSYGVTA